MRLAAIAVALSALAGCGGGDTPSSQLMDGSAPPSLPAELAAVGGVMSRVVARNARDVGGRALERCERRIGARASARTRIVRRVGVEGASMTLRIGPLLYACDAIAEPAPDPDRISDDPWCGGAVGALEDGRLTDPRLALCTAKDGRVTAFVWVEVESPVRWVGVRGRGRALELYQVAGGLPVRVAATREVDPEGSASLDLVEYDADGAELRSYTLSALVAG